MMPFSSRVAASPPPVGPEAQASPIEVLVARLARARSGAVAIGIVAGFLLMAIVLSLAPGYREPAPGIAALGLRGSIEATAH